jgi:hypothetical protein
MGLFRLLLLYCLLNSGFSVLTAQHFRSRSGHFGLSQSTVRDTIQRALWISRNAEELLRDIHEDRLDNYKSAEVEVNNNPGFEIVTFRFGDDGKITFSDGSYLLFALHSFHEDAQLGDIVLAVDFEGNLYIQEEHVCGGLAHFFRSGQHLPENSQRFILEFMGEISKQHWLGIELPLLR